ncbi:hypothetical protein GGI26_006030 [Coemansia sp. RSA 1358]|nr:hypothetical protein EDC05_004618 [Coemansia umbellata]KAJ2619182.1 hypothetical protein GGI26_006030 [Coemansia sp. RSA 1358]
MYFVAGKQEQADEFGQEMAMVIELLKSREVAEKELRSQYLANSSEGAGAADKKHTLYDHIDQEAVNALELRTRECVGELSAISKDELELCREALKRIEEVEVPTAEDISVTWAGVKEIDRLVKESQEVMKDMEQDLASMDRHCDQLRDTIRDLEADGGSVLSINDYNVLLRDTEEIPAIVAELQDLVDGIQRRADETNVRYLQYTAFFDDNKRQFDAVARIAELAHEYTEKTAETQARFAQLAREADMALSDTWGLISWYRSFHTAYDSLIEEMQRRRQAQRQQHAAVEDMRARLESMYMEEVRVRTEFVDRAGPFLPSDLCPFIQDPPPYFVVEETGDVGRLASVQSHETRYSKVASAMMVEGTVASHGES